MAVTIFDKIINVRFYRQKVSENDIETSSARIDDIICPLTGRKPDINIQYSKVAAGGILQLELRVKNFAPSVNLIEYKWVTIEYGYKQDQKEVIGGEVFSAFIEKPPPDSETVFIINTGFYNTFVTTTLTKSYQSDTDTALNIINDIVTAVSIDNNINLNIKYTGEAQSKISEPLKCNITYDNRTISQVLEKLKIYFNNNIVFRTQGDTLYICDILSDTGKNKVILEYITTARNSAQIINMTCPVIPNLNPDDEVVVNPRYFNRLLANIYMTTTNYKVVKIDISFGTIDDMNEMSILCVPTDMFKEYISAMSKNQVGI